MPILADLSRRIHLLTTDAKPDPPRIDTDGNTHNLRPRKLSNKSSSSTQETETTDKTKPSVNRQSSVPEGSSDNEKERRNSAEKKQTRYRRSQSTKNGQTANIVNYNIVNSSGVKIGATTTYVCNINQYPGSSPKDMNHQESPPKPRHPSMSEEIEALCKLNRIVTIDDMFLVKTHLGHDWKDVFKSLDYSEGQLEQFQEQHHAKGLDEVIYQVLLDWKQSMGSEARISLLLGALWRCEQYDCAQRLAGITKNL